MFGASRGVICGRIRGATLALSTSSKPRSVNPAKGRGAASKQTQKLIDMAIPTWGAFSITFRLTRNSALVELPRYATNQAENKRELICYRKTDRSNHADEPMSFVLDRTWSRSL
jgi:hypothetical protein